MPIIKALITSALLIIIVADATGEELFECPAPYIDELSIGDSLGVKGEQKHPSGYPGVTVYLGGNFVRSYNEEAAALSASWDGNPKPETIVNELAERFLEAVSAYDKGKEDLPACLRQGVDKELKGLRDGPDKLYIGYSPHPRATSKEQESAWQTLGSAAASGATTCPLTDDWKLTAASVTMSGGFDKTYPCNLDGNKPKLTAHAILHELFHVTIRTHPECFAEFKEKDVDGYLMRPEEESIVEDATVRIFGESNVCMRYRDQVKFDEVKATFENMCQCRDECPY